MDSRVEADLSIDRNNLDAEWTRQSLLYDQYSDELAERNAERNRIKDELEVLKAQKDIGIRDGSIGVAVKLTEVSIKSLVAADEEVVAKQKELNQKSYEAAVIDGVVQSLNHKKKALESLVTLNVIGYYSEPKGNRADSIRDLRRDRMEENNG